MKKLIYILILISFAASAQTINVGVPFDKNNPHDNSYNVKSRNIKGSYHEGTKLDRDSLITFYSTALELGMPFYCTDVDSTFRWNGLVWIPIGAGNGLNGFIQNQTSSNQNAGFKIGNSFGYMEFDNPSANPELKIFGNGTSTVDPTLNLGGSKMDGNIRGFYFDALPGGGEYHFRNNGGMDRLTVMLNGNVGINNINPQYPFSATPLQYNTGTAAQSGTAITGTGTTFTNAMVGSVITYNNGTYGGIISAYVDATHLTSNISATVSNQSFQISYNALNVTNTGHTRLDVAPTTATGTNPSLVLVNGEIQQQVISGGGGGTWGSITGTLSSQTDLQAALNLKANNASPVLSGTPSAPNWSIYGTGGNGYYDMLSQSASPASVSGHLRIYSDSLNRFSWKNSTYRRTIQVPKASDVTIRMPYLATTTLTDSAQVSNTYTKPLTPIGDIFNQSTFSTVSPLTQTSGWSATGGHLVGVGTGGYTERVSLPNATALDGFKLFAKYRFTTTSTADSGLKVGMVSPSVASTYAFINHAAGADFGKVFFQEKYTGTFQSYKSTAAIPSISSTDSLTITSELSGGMFTVTGTNITTGKSVTVTGTTTFTYNTPGTTPSTSYPSIIAGNGTYEVNQFQYASKTVYADATVLGNSISQGYNSQGHQNRYAEILGWNIDAGSGDFIQTYQLHLSELWKYANKPKYVFIQVNVNDLNTSSGGLGYPACMPTYQAVHDTLVAHGLAVYWLLAPPANTLDVTSLNAGVVSTFGAANCIDIYTPLWSGTSYTMNAAYNSGDGVHPNQSGHALIASTILNSTLYKSLQQSPVKLYYPYQPVFTPGDYNALVNKGWVENLFSTATVTLPTTTVNTILKSTGSSYQNSGLTESSGIFNFGTEDLNTTGHINLNGATATDFLNIAGTNAAVNFQSATTGTYRFGNYNTNTGGFTLQRTDGTNINTNLSIVGKGTGVSFDTKNIISGFNLSGYNDVISVTNAEFLRFEAWQGNGYGIFSDKNGTGSLRPLTIDMTGVSRGSMKQTVFNTDGSVNFGYTVKLSAGTTTAPSFNIPSGVIKTSGQVSGDISNVSGIPHWYDGSADQSIAFITKHTILTPTTGGTVTVVKNQTNIINPAGTLASLTIAMPSSPSNNDVVYIKFSQSITSLTFSGGTVAAQSTSTAGTMYTLTYDSGTSTWY